VPTSRTIDDRVALIDVAPTVVRLLGLTPFDADGIDLGPSFNGARLPERDLYAESFAPLLDFGWSPLHAIRSREWKYIEAPRPELYNINRDPDEERDLSTSDLPKIAELHGRLARQSASAPGNVSLDPEARAAPRRLCERIRWHDERPPRGSEGQKEEASQLAQVTSGEL
jgi:arylsulfatase A-like enzyme